MGEINEALGKGKKYTIDGKEYEVLPATLADLEEVADIAMKITEGVAFNFFQFPGEKEKDLEVRKSALFKILEKAFRGEVPKEKLKQLRRDEVKEITDFFLYS